MSTAEERGERATEERGERVTEERGERVTEVRAYRRRFHLSVLLNPEDLTACSRMWIYDGYDSRCEKGIGRGAHRSGDSLEIVWR
jgi:hypothetical protein